MTNFEGLPFGAGEDEMARCAWILNEIETIFYLLEIYSAFMVIYLLLL